MIIIRRKKEPVLICMTCRKKRETCSPKLSTVSIVFALDTNSHMYIRFNFRIDESALLQTFLFLSAIISSLYFLDYSRNKKRPEGVYAGCGCKKELPVC